MKNQLLMQLILEVKQDPSFMKKVIDACIYGIYDANKELNERLVKSEKASFMLMNKHMKVLHIDDNIQDVVESLNNSHFNGGGTNYTKEDVIKELQR